MKWPFLYDFDGKGTVFPFLQEFQASVTILRTLTLQNAIWPKRAPRDLKRRFIQFLWKAHCFPVLKRICSQFNDFKNFNAQKCDLAKTCSAWPENSVLYNFHRKRTIFLFCRGFGASVTILRTLMLKNAIWAKRAPHDVKRAFCTIFMESALFFRLEENLSLVSRFWKLWRSKNAIWPKRAPRDLKERFIQFSWKAHCFPVLKRICSQFNDFKNFNAQKCDLAKTCSAWHEKSVLYNFHEKGTVFPFWRECQASFTILITLTLQNAIWPKRAPHDLKTAFCTILMKSALVSLL